jgi:Xaa-Pro aminopeptidase
MVVAPFDTDRLDRLMDAAGLDAILATSKHNIQYLTGGHRSQFFDAMDAIGVSRYLPVFVYPKGQAGRAAYFGHRFEANQFAINPRWMSEVQTRSWGSVDGMEAALDYLEQSALLRRRIGVEQVVDAQLVLERLRALKSKHELDLIRKASELVVDSMLAVIASHGAGASKIEIVEALKREETRRGLTFEYCLLTMGASINRAVSDQKWEAGALMSLDSGGNYHGYIGDLARMAVLGEPDSELVDLLGEITAMQLAARMALRAGVTGDAVFAAVEPMLHNSAHRAYTDFMAHGVGLVTHEAPRMTSKGPVPYPGEYAAMPLEPGMVVSIETTMRHPLRGFIKLEDTAAVTADGCEVFADLGQGWNHGCA